MYIEKKTEEKEKIFSHENFIFNFFVNFLAKNGEYVIDNVN